MNTKIDNTNPDVNSVGVGIVYLEGKVKDMVIKMKCLEEEIEKLNRENMVLEDRLEEIEHKTDDHDENI